MKLCRLQPDAPLVAHPPSLDHEALLHEGIACHAAACVQDRSGNLHESIIGLVGGFFLSYGLRAVHLTQMANRVWKRTAEYGLIVNGRRRLGR